MKIRKHFAIITVLITLFAGNAVAQDYTPQKSSIGFNFGSLTYSGRFAVDASLASHSSLYASLAYRRKVWKNLHIRAELFGGRLRGDNDDIPSQANKPHGWFQTEMAEASVRGEYDFIDLRNHKFSPFLNAGVGVYTLFNYSSSFGDKEGSDKIGFAMPVGGGVKYKLNKRIKLLAEGNARLFTGNLDNRTGKGINNPNLYYSFGFGVIYELAPGNMLW